MADGPVSSIFVRRHVGMLIALLAYQMPELKARNLIDQAKTSGRREIQVVAGGRVLEFRRMRGNHCDVYEISVPEMQTHAATSADVIEQVEWLANVPPGGLAQLLVATWGADGSLVAAERLQAHQRTFVLRAGAKRRAEAKRPQADVREVVDELLRTRVCSTKTAAFRKLAAMRCVDAKTVSNAYYCPKT